MRQSKFATHNFALSMRQTCRYFLFRFTGKNGRESRQIFSIHLKCLVRCLRALSFRSFAFHPNRKGALSRSESNLRLRNTIAKWCVHWHSSLVDHVQKTASQFDFTEDRVPSSPPCKTAMASPRTRFAACTLWDLHFRHLRDAYLGFVQCIMKFVISFFSLSSLSFFFNRKKFVYRFVVLMQ